MKLTVVYDNEAKGDLQSSWGFSCFIETGAKKILFDTGWDGHLLLRNMDKLSISSESIDILVLSHQHWDHIGGVPALLDANQDMDIYVPSAFSANLRNDISSRCRSLNEIKGPQQICKGVYTTGQLGREIKEQSLVLDSGKGLYVIVGCSHPGLAAILDAASAFGDVIGIIGGLHDSQEYDLLSGMQVIGAGHCTVHKANIREMYPDAFVEIFAGYSREI
ncbi:MAG: MBL fold metallo-hydrolase [Methanosarcinaceae archaeon]|nr:MBL fold metallo-hydrolase [Methanosarcinaceae archaeon]